MALTEQEQYIVDRSKVWYFGAFLQACWFQYPDLLKEIGAGDFPETETLQSLNEKMTDARIDFDFIYLIDLPEREINPLKTEQEAWKLLSPLIKKHEKKFGDYIENYSLQNVDQEQLLTHTYIYRMEFIKDMECYIRLI